MRIIRNHWGVELNHQTLDVALLEDDHPWIEQNPRAAYALAVLRRIAYTLLALFRSVTQRSELRRAVPGSVDRGGVGGPVPGRRRGPGRRFGTG